MVSDEPTFADCMAYGTITQLLAEAPALLDQFPALKQWKADFEALPAIVAYKASPQAL